MLNSVTLVGRMAGDAELRYTPNNQQWPRLGSQSIALLKIKMASAKQTLLTA